MKWLKIKQERTRRGKRPFWMFASPLQSNKKPLFNIYCDAEQFLECCSFLKMHLKKPVFAIL